MITIKRKIYFTRRSNRTKAIVENPRPSELVEPGRIPRISRLMALAIQFDRLIRQGKATDQSELARLCHVTQPRMSQIMALNQLAPDIQEQLLFLPRCVAGRDAIHEKMLRRVSGLLDWSKQRESFAALVSSNH
jgi:hypothetical protein